MSKLKSYKEENVLDAARRRVEYAFDHFEKVYVSFSGGKDSSVTLHLSVAEAIKRKRVLGVLLIDLEAQYNLTIQHAREMFKTYAAHIDLHWVCLPMLLRNAVSNYEPRWCCWDKDARECWVREYPEHVGVRKNPSDYPFFVPKMEFEEFMALWGVWYSEGKPTAGLVGIRCDESLNRFRTIASKSKEMHGTAQYTTKVEGQLYNLYPIYDWRTQDIWRFHAKYPELAHNGIYDRMYLAKVPLSHMRLCQPYGDDQRRGLWLYHLLEPETWFKVVARVNGANSGALYIEETGNMTGYNKITKPPGNTWKTFCNLLLKSLPKPTRQHYTEYFQKWIVWWARRGYVDGIPDETPHSLEVQKLTPSWKRMCKVLLRNDWWCKGMGFTQPASEAYRRYMTEFKQKKQKAA